MTTQALPIVTVVDGTVTTLSTDVASFFGKPHNDVLKSIRRIIESLPPDRLGNFSQTVVSRENPSGGDQIKSTAYRLTRDGFTFLAMGFTGERAQAFKWAYIDAFNKMEMTLRKVECPIATITPAQQLQLREAVASRAKSVSAHYQTIYRALYARFQIPRYTELLAKDFDAAMEFIRTVDLRTPERIESHEEPKKPEPSPKTDDQVLVSRSFLERQMTFVYLWKYLYRPVLDRFYLMLKMADSPHAPRLWEAIHDLHLSMVERDLEQLGFDVKQMKEFKFLVSQS